MLAGYGIPAGSLEGWAAKPKLDGWRATVTVTVTQGHVHVRSRHGKNLGDALPTLTALGERGQGFVLAGELVARQGRLSDFYEVAPRLSSRKGRGAPITFCVFDLLWLDGEDLTPLPHKLHRKQLEALDLAVPDVAVVPSWPGLDAADLLRACDEQGMESVVLKRLASRYRPGARSYDWRKVKCAAWTEHLERRRPR